MEGQEEQELEITQLEQAAVRNQDFSDAPTNPTRLFHYSNFDYQNTFQLGKGGFGDAYLVKHKLFKRRKFVLKRFRIDVLGQVTQNWPWKELHALQYLQHINICKLYGAFCSDVPTLVLEACYGEIV